MGRGGGDDAVGEARERQGLEPDGAGAGEFGVEEALAAEELILDALDELDVVVDAGFEADEAAGVDAEGLAGGEGALDDGAAGVEEELALACGGDDFLEDEALAAEEADAKLALEGDGNFDAAGGAEEGVLLADEGAGVVGEFDGDDVAGEWCGEGAVGALVAVVGEHGDEEGLAGDGALASLEELAHQALALGGHGEAGAHLDAVLHVHHGTGLGDDGLAGVEGDDDGLDVVADDLVVDLVAGHGGSFGRLLGARGEIFERGGGEDHAESAEGEVGWGSGGVGFFGGCGVGIA